MFLNNCIVVCSEEPVMPRGCGSSNQRRSKPQVPNLVGHLARVSYVCLVELLKGKWWGWWCNGGTLGAVKQISWHLPYDWGKPRKTSVRKPSGALSSMISHCFKWCPFPPNDVGMVMLPALLAKPIGPSQKSVLKNLRSGIRRSHDIGSALQGHSSNIQFLRACIPKYAD